MNSRHKLNPGRIFRLATPLLVAIAACDPVGTSPGQPDAGAVVVTSPPDAGGVVTAPGQPDAGGVVTAPEQPDAGGVVTAPGQPDAGAIPPSIQSFASDLPSVAVGERAQLTAVFQGDAAVVEGIGPVQSGQPVQTAPLSRTSTFTLTVHQGSQQAQSTLTVSVHYRDRIRRLADAAVARTRHLALALPDGDALLMGGNSSESLNVPDSDTSQRFDIISERLVDGPGLALRALEGLFTQAVTLRSGGFLLAGGGLNSGAGLRLPSDSLSQSFDPTTQQFVRRGGLRFSHGSDARAVLLSDGRVLMTGGNVPGTPAAETFDPSTGTWTEVSLMGTGRRGHSATLLPDGKVLIAGGIVCCTNNSETYSASAELFDPASGAFQPTGPLGTARGYHQATVLSDGRVLLSGGLAPVAGPPGSQSSLAASEIYDPADGRFSPAGDLGNPRALHSTLLLTDGRVLAVGGRSGTGAAVATTELFDPATLTWGPGPRLDPAWNDSTATLLSGGKVLLFGGENSGGFPQSSVQIFE